MGYLALLYRQNADRLRRQRIGFDFLAIGAGIASVANSIGRGAQTATLALAGTSATSTAASTYFGSDARIAAYETAWSTLFCGQNVASDLGAIDASKAATTDQWLRDAITSAQASSKASNTTKTADGAALATSVITSAQKSLTNLDQALAGLFSGTSRLQDFTISTEISATSKATTGIQNVSATVAAVKAALSPSGSGTIGSTSGGQQLSANLGAEASSLEPNFGAMTLAQITVHLTNLSASSDQIAKDIVDKFGRLADCVK